MNKLTLERIIWVWYERLGLNHWELEINWDDPTDDDHEHAVMWRAKDYFNAKLRFSKNWENWSLKDANDIVVHELLHLGTREVEYILDAIDQQMHRDVDKIICDMHRHNVEGAIDYLAKRIVIIGGMVGGETLDAST